MNIKNKILTNSNYKKTIRIKIKTMVSISEKIKTKTSREKR